jgi:holo-[acyl-carrier protein] synthase
MSIIGIGIDICSNIRIENLIKTYDLRFLEKVFNKKEIEHCMERYGRFEPNFFAKRFAGKEAFVKAIGVGFNQFIRKNEIIILNDPVYKNPTILLIDSTKDYVENTIGKNCQYFISMSDEKEFSIANTTIWRSVSNV